MLYGEAVRLVAELAKTFGSHFMAELAGWTTPATYGDIVALQHAQAVIAAQAWDGEKPHVLTPWDGADPNTDVDDAERDRLRQLLEQRSALR